MRKILFACGLLTSFGGQAALEATNCVIVEPEPSSNEAYIFFDIRFRVTDEIEKLRIPGPESIQGAAIKGVSDSAEIHEIAMKDGVMTMKQITQYKIKPNTLHQFKPGGHYLMIRDFSQRPVAGEEYELSVWSTYTEDPSCMAKVVKSADLAMLKSKQVGNAE